MNLLRNQFPEVFGSESIDLAKNCYFTKHVGKFIQLINIDNLHWICMSSILNNNEEVYVYASLKTGEYSNHIKKVFLSFSDRTFVFANVLQQVEISGPKVSSTKDSTWCFKFSGICLIFMFWMRP